MADPIKDLYKTLQQTGLFVDEADLRTQLKAAPKDVYALVEKDGLFVDYSDFESALSLKKKDASTPIGSAAQNGGPLISPSTSTSTSPLPLFGSPKKAPTDKIGQQVAKNEEKRRRESFADVEAAFREHLDAQAGVAPENQPALPMGTASSQQWLSEKKARDEANLRLAEQKKEATLKDRAPDLYAPVKELIDSGKYKNFYDGQGNFKTGEAIDYFDKVVRARGGGSFTRDALVATFRANAPKPVSEDSRQTVRKVVDKVSGRTATAGRALASGWYQGLANLGNALASKGVDNSLTRYLQGKDYDAQQVAPGEYKWNKDEWIDRGITSAGQSLGASAPTMIPSAAVTLATGGAGGVLVGGTMGFFGERAQNAGSVYDQVLQQTGDPALARQQADHFERKQTITLPLYYLDALTKIKMFNPARDITGKVIKGGLLENMAAGAQKYIIGNVDMAQELVTEYYQGYTEAQATQGYKGSFQDYVSEHPDTVGDVLAATIGSNVGFSAAGKIYRTLGSSTPAAKQQFYADVVAKEGPEMAHQVIDQALQTGALSEEQAAQEKGEIDKVAHQVESLKPLGIEGDDAKAYIALSEELQGLEQQIGETDDPTVLSALKIKAEEVEADLRALVAGKGSYVKVTYPGGARQTAVLPLPHFRQLQRSGQAASLIQSAESVEAVGDDALNQEVQAQKGEIGNAEGAPEGFYENEAAVKESDGSPQAAPLPAVPQGTTTEGRGERQVVLERDEPTMEVRGDKNHSAYIIKDADGNTLGHISFNYREDLGGYQIENAKVEQGGKGVGTEVYRQLIAQLDKPLISDSSRTEAAEKLWKKLEREGLAEFNEENGKYYSKKPADASPQTAPSVSPSPTPTTNADPQGRGETQASERPENWSDERLSDEVGKLNPYESQGYNVVRNRELKEAMQENPKQARLAFILRDFAGRVWGKTLSKDWQKAPLSSLSMFFHSGVNSLGEWVDEQIKGEEAEIESKRRYIDSLGNSKSDKQSKAYAEEGIASAKQRIEDMKKEFAAYQSEVASEKNNRNSPQPSPAPSTEQGQQRGETPAPVSENSSVSPSESPAPSKESFREAILSALENATGSELEEVISDLALQDSDRKTAVKNIRRGKSTVATKKVEAAIDKMWADGYVYLNRGRGDHAESFQMPIQDFMQRIQGTSEEFADLSRMAENLQTSLDALGEDLFADTVDEVVEEVRGETSPEPLPNSFENSEAIVDALTDKYKGQKDIVFHGSPDISFLNSVEDFDTANNTQNAESKYIFVNARPKYAYNYSTSYDGIRSKSGVGVFKLGKGKKYTLTSKDIANLPDNAAYEAFHDQKKAEGYDYIVIPQDGNNIVVLNPKILTLVGVENNFNLLGYKSPQSNEPQSTASTPEDTVPPPSPANPSNEEAGSAGSPPQDAAGGEAGAAPAEGVQMIHAATAEIRKDNNLPDYERHPGTIEAWDAEAKERIAKGEMSSVLDKLRTARELTPVEVRMGGMYIASLAKEVDANPSKENLAALREAVELFDAIGSRDAQNLRARQGTFLPEDNLAGQLVQRMAAAGVEELTDKQKAEVEQMVSDLKKANEALTVKLAEAEEANLRLQAEAEVRATRREQSDRKSPRTKDYKKEREDIKAKIKEKLRKSRGQANDVVTAVIDFAAIAPDVARLMRSYVEEGVVTLGEIIQKIHQDVHEVEPTITEDNIRDIIAGVYNKPRPTKSEVLQQIEELRLEARLINQLEALENGAVPKSERAQRERNQKIKDLREKIKGLKDVAKRDEAIARNIEKLEAELARVRERREKAPADARERRPLTVREHALQEQIKAEKARWAEEKKSRPQGPESLEKIKVRNEAKLKELQERLANKDFAARPKPKSAMDNPELREKHPELYQQTLDAISAVEKARHELAMANLRDEMSRRPRVQKVMAHGGKIARTLKATMAGIDMSAIAVQNLLAILANPATGAKGIVTSVVHTLKPMAFERSLAEIHSADYWPLVEASGLSIVDPKSLRASEMNDIFNNTYYDDLNINYKGRKVNLAPTKPFERAFTSLGNYLRLNIFLRRAEKLINEGKTIETHPDEFKLIAQVVNNMTGRGTMNELFEKNAELLSTVFWSPRLMASSFNLIGVGDAVNLVAGKKGFYGRVLTSEQKAWAAYQIGAGFVYGVTLMLAFAYADDEAEIDWDPTSVTFGYVKSGDYSWSIFGRYTKPIRYIAMRATGKKTTERGEVELDENAYGATFGKELATGARGYLNPVFGAGLSMAIGRDFSNQPTDVPTEVSKMLYPMSFSEFKKGYDTDGAAGILKRGVPSFAGVRVTHKKDFESPIQAPQKVKHNEQDVPLNEEQQKAYADFVNERYQQALLDLKTRSLYAAADKAKQADLERFVKQQAKQEALDYVKKKYPAIFPKETSAERRRRLLEERERERLKRSLGFK